MLSLYLQSVVLCFITICVCSIYLDRYPFYANTHLCIHRTVLVSFLSVIIMVPCIIYTVLVMIYGMERIREKKHLYDDDEEEDYLKS
jgi:hypothetical protein